jgi:hypothetical protein
MEKRLALLVGMYFFCMAAAPLPVLGQEAAPPDHEAAAHPLSIAGFNITGGISAGNFYTSNAGPATSDNQWLLSNMLVEISRQDKTAPVGFTAAFGQTSTPSILSTPENKNTVDIEYASLTLTPVNGLGVDVGLLQPSAGYENSYTYNNKNTFLGALASQQPYNAYGARVGYDFSGLNLCAGYYKDRLDDEEYVTDKSSPNESWELGLSATILDSKISLYHYHLESLRNLTGAVIEHSIGNVDLGLNIDYWQWDSRMKTTHGSDSSIGTALYFVPKFDKVSIPVRLEYIDQGQSGIYIDNAPEIYAATVSPTYHYNDHIYIRADAGYVKADKGFADENGTLKDDRVVLAAEVGFRF